MFYSVPPHFFVFVECMLVIHSLEMEKIVREMGINPMERPWVAVYCGKITCPDPLQAHDRRSAVLGHFGLRDCGTRMAGCMSTAAVSDLRRDINMFLFRVGGRTECIGHLWMCHRGHAQLRDTRELMVMDLRAVLGTLSHRG